MDQRSTGRSSVVLAFLPATPSPSLSSTQAGSESDTLERELASVKGLSVGIMSATQGAYSSTQLLLDITQGARIASSGYSHAHPPSLSPQPLGTGAVITGWRAALERAEGAPQLLRPGLLAAQIPGGAAYAGIAGTDDIDAIAAANRSGHIAAVSTGSAQTLLERIAALRASRRLVVADLPGGAEGRTDLSALSAERDAGELLLVIQRARAARGHELLWVAAAGLPGGAGKTLTSQTTNERGLIAAVDIAPTILHRLDLTPVPADMRGDPLRTDGALHSASLRALMARLHVIAGRRLKALACLVGAWALLLVLASLSWPRRGGEARAKGAPSRRLGYARAHIGAERASVHTAGSARARAWAMRTGAIGVMWAPIAVLIPAAIEPSAAVEYAAIALACLALGALTDLLLPWPRAPLAPALAAVVVLTVDALAGTQLLVRSLLGPDPILGARFYGIGNELKSTLAVLVLAAVAAALYPGARRNRRTAIVAMALAGMVLAAIEGSARIGAGVGGVILVAGGFAVAIVMLLPGELTRKRALSVLLAPVLALVALAALDLATAHGSGHFTGSILHARSAGDLRDVIVRRYGAAWEELKNHAMPIATAFALLCAGLGLRRRDRLLAPVAGDLVWRAALVGGLTAGVVGALVEDSGPVLLVVAVFVLGCVMTYLWARPPRAGRGRSSAAAGRAGRPSSVVTTGSKATSAR
ncbi:MAG TPA: hypothetical protein VGL68_00250 [Solirubrobacteraceae bacterium]|jgi:hypothetical protein